MKRIRLDIGALTASPEDGGSFMFFLYREGMDKCLPVKLSPAQMHAVLSNFNQQQQQEVFPTLHNFFFTILQQFRIELLEVTVAVNEQTGRFICQLLLFDGDKEVTETCDFIDGIILAKIFASPIYTSLELMEQHASDIDLASEKIVQKEIRLQKLKEELANAIAAEDYERAAVVNRAIESINKEEK